MYGRLHGHKLIESKHCYKQRLKRHITIKDIKHQLKYHPEIRRYPNRYIAIVDSFQSIIIKLERGNIVIITAIDDMLTNPKADVVLSDC